ncbi:endonuclease domain-containing protein [Saccharicrinis sp. FJH62]|uniref:endonuclease domain-containing protein n=1 Tax=Saccharicrinis sp. FJH62 TaxID=3344657 RepID=UPI0035D49EA9
MEKRLTPIQVARELRKNMTPSERILWDELRNKKLGVKFLRQHPIIYEASATPVKFFVVDFYCAAKKLVIEIDGGIHETQKDWDVLRDFELQKRGYKVIRIKNDEVEDINKLIERIQEFLNN